MHSERACRTTRRRGGWTTALLAVSFLAFVAVPPAGLAVVREAWIERLSSAEVRTQWDDFRGAMLRQTGRDGPVQRKAPRSVEPPQLVWLRDHFGLACAAWLLFGGVLWGVTAFLVVGATTVTSPGSVEPSPPPPGRGSR